VWAMLARLVLSLGVVLALMLGAAFVLRKRGGGMFRRGSSGLPLEILARQTLARTASVQVVRVGDRAVVLGVTEQSVSYITEGDPSEFEPDVAVDLTMASAPGSSADRTARSGGGNRLGSSWNGVLDSLRDKSTRR
jgi:flagellar protein FliO/FliZ